MLRREGCTHSHTLGIQLSGKKNQICNNKWNQKRCCPLHNKVFIKLMHQIRGVVFLGTLDSALRLTAKPTV